MAFKKNRYIWNIELSVASNSYIKDKNYKRFIPNLYLKNQENDELKMEILSDKMTAILWIWKW